MLFVTTQPEMLASTAGSLQAIGSAMAANNSAAAGPTTGVIPAAADEVSALTATPFAMHAAMYEAISAINRERLAAMTGGGAVIANACS